MEDLTQFREFFLTFEWLPVRNIILERVAQIEDAAAGRVDDPGPVTDSHASLSGKTLDVLPAHPAAAGGGGRVGGGGDLFVGDYAMAENACPVHCGEHALRSQLPETEVDLA